MGRWDRHKDKARKPWIPDREWVVCPAWCTDKKTGKYSWVWKDHHRATCFTCGVAFPGVEGTPKPLEAEGGKPAGKGMGKGKGAAAANEKPAADVATYDNLKVMFKALNMEWNDELIDKMKTQVEPQAEEVPAGKAHRQALGKLTGLENQLKQREAKLDAGISAHVAWLETQKEDIKGIKQQITEAIELVRQTSVKHLPEDVNVTEMLVDKTPLDVLMSNDTLVLSTAAKARDVIKAEATSYGPTKKGGSKTAGSRYSPLGENADDEDVPGDDELDKQVAAKISEVDAAAKAYHDAVSRASEAWDLLKSMAKNEKHIVQEVDVENGSNVGASSGPSCG